MPLHVVHHLPEAEKTHATETCYNVGEQNNVTFCVITENLMHNLSSHPGTVVKAGEGEMMKKMSEAFDMLEEDLWRVEGGGGRGRRRELVRMSLPVTFAER